MFCKGEIQTNNKMGMGKRETKTWPVLKRIETTKKSIWQELGEV